MFATSSQIAWSLTYFAVSGGFAIAFVVAIVWLIRARAHPWWLFVVLAVPITALLADPDWRVSSAHGLYHYSIVYEIFERGAPPALPLAAGLDLQYFYAVHFVVAQLMKAFALAPPWAFAALGLLCLLAMVAIVDRLARLVWDDTAYRWLAMTAVLFGVAVLAGDPFGRAFANWGVIAREGRLDLLHKFMDVNNHQLGLVLFALAFLGLVNLVAEGGRAARGLVLFGAGWLLVGLFYPLGWLGTAIVAAVALGQLAAFERPMPWRKLLWLSALCVGGAALLAPWFLSLTADKSAAGAIRPTLDIVARNAPILAAALAVPVLLAAWKRQLLVSHVRARPRLFAFLALSAGALMTAFLFVYIPTHAEYKMLQWATVPLGLMFALALRQMLDQRRALAAAMLFLLVLPFSHKIGPYLVFGWPVSDPATSSGRFLVHRVPEQQALYEWIATRSPADAVFVDSYLTIPAFARRPLLVGTELRRERGELHVAGERGERKDGWGPVSELILQVNGVPPDLVARRRAIARALLAETEAPVPGEVLDALRDEVPGRAAYIVARHDPVIARLGREARLTPVWRNGAATVFALDAAGR